MYNIYIYTQKYTKKQNTQKYTKKTYNNLQIYIIYIYIYRNIPTINKKHNIQKTNNQIYKNIHKNAKIQTTQQHKKSAKNTQ